MERAVRCGSRLREVCPGCANLAYGDYHAILRSGVFDASATDRFIFLTVTAPSFGPVHRVAKDAAGARSCRCGQIHDPRDDADLRGIPLDVATYDYAAQVDFNATAGQLWNATRTLLVQHFPGLTYAGAYEDQARGAVHLHVLLRLPGDIYAPSVPEQIRALVSGVVTTSRDTGLQRTWGRQIDVRSVIPGADLGRTLSYTLKSVIGYLTKEVADAGGGRSPRQSAHWASLRQAARDHRCAGCRRIEGSRDLPLIYCAEHHPMTGELVMDENRAFRWLPSGDVLDLANGELLDPESGDVVADTAECPTCDALRREHRRKITRCTSTLHRQNGRRSHPVVWSP